MLIYSHVNCASRNPRALASTKYPRFWTDAGLATGYQLLGFLRSRRDLGP